MIISDAKIASQDWDIQGTTSCVFTYDRMPAILVSHRTSTDLWIFRKQWFRRGKWVNFHQFSDATTAYTILGLTPA